MAMLSHSARESLGHHLVSLAHPVLSHRLQLQASRADNDDRAPAEVQALTKSPTWQDCSLLAFQPVLLLLEENTLLGNMEDSYQSCRSMKHYLGWTRVNMTALSPKNTSMTLWHGGCESSCQFRLLSSTQCISRPALHPLSNHQSHQAPPHSTFSCARPDSCLERPASQSWLPCIRSVIATRLDDVFILIHPQQHP
ncbi:hypothetical protein MHYP_G00187020 [Metynnis hypsauchen]